VRFTRLLVVLAAVPAIGAAQSVRGVVLRDAGVPATGVVVMLTDTAGAAVARTLSSEAGAYRVLAPGPGTFRIRTLRIGFKPETTEPITLANGQERTRDITLANVPVTLDTVRVASRSSCKATGDTAVATYAVWEQVRGALTAAQVTAAAADLSVAMMSYERTMDPTFRGVRKQNTSFAQSLSVRPWRSASADELRRSGYVVDDLSGGKTYLAPDLDVLLSAEFAEDHCLRVASTSRETLIGIEFVPTKERTKIAEISGTVWVDRASAEVRSMDFRYEGLTVSETEARPGGQMEFLRLKDGGWVIARWNIRMPVVTLSGEYSGTGALFRTEKQRVNEIRVAGGEVLSVVRGADTVFARAPLSVAGEVIDSLSRVRIDGARVSLRGTSLSDTTDRNGQFSIRNVLPGEYGMDIRTPSLDSVGRSYTATVTVSDPPARLRFNVPSADDYAAEFCPSEADSNKASGLLLGTLRLDGDTTPPWNVAVTAQWEDGKEKRTLSARTDAQGRYRMCGAPIARQMAIRSELDDTAAAPVRYRIPGRKRFAVVNITVPKPVVVAGTLFAGSVATEWSREPLADAEVTFPALNISVRTNAQGRFRIAGVPPGTHKVSARKVGYAATEMEIAFSGPTPVVRQFLLGGVATLDPVAVKARAILPDFDEHRALGHGHFLTRADLEKAEGRKFSEVMREVPGIDLIAGRGVFAWIRSSRVPRWYPNQPLIGPNASNLYIPERFEALQGMTNNCYTQVYLDAMLMNPGRPTPPFDLNSLSVHQLEAVEYYASPVQAPPKYQKFNASCGVLVLHTRRTK
jgi:hypothetical protein